MADVLLTHSYHLPYDAKQVRKMQPYTPLGTLYAATALREKGISVAVFDLNARGAVCKVGNDVGEASPQGGGSLRGRLQFPFQDVP